MTRHLLRRASRARPPDFPHSPTLQTGEPCDGLAFVIGAGAPTPDLTALHEAVAGLWRGPLEPGWEVVVAVFAAATVTQGRAGPRALPLTAAPGGRLVSFAEPPNARERAPPPGAAARRLELWWGGRRVRLALDSLRPLPIADLWPRAQLTVHAAAPRARSFAAPRPAPNEGDAAALAPVTHAKVEVAGDALLKSVSDRLAGLREQTRLSAILGRLFGGEGKAQAGAGGAEPRPGLLESLAGWLRWHTPFGDMRGQLNERMQRVEQLLRKGDIDAALMLAIAVGADLSAKARSLFPFRLGARTSLDFRPGAGLFSAPVMASGSLMSLTQRYAQLAEQLIAKGDHRRAAWVQSQLMNDHRKGVLTLEAGGLFREAARLALDAKLEPALAIRMLYKAGELGAALTLARRTACFEELAAESKADDRFHAFVIEAWTQMLAATGQPLRALQVTDHLPGPGPEGRRARRGWLLQAIAQVGGDVGDELAARALLCADWSGDDLSVEALEHFPHAPAPPGPFGEVFESIQRRVDGADRRTGAGLLAALSRLSARAHPEQVSFWTHAALPFCEAFARALLESTPQGLSPSQLEVLGRLLEVANSPVLAADLGKLRALHANPRQAERRWRAPSPDVAPTAPAACGCLIGDGSTMVWRQSRTLQLFDGRGALAWQGQVSDVAALVPIASGPNVIVIQASDGGAPMLSRFSTYDRRFHPIGRVALKAHHDITSESQWLVQIGGEIGALDLAKLCAPQPQIEFLWACALTERLRTLAFVRHAMADHWLTVDISPGRAGVVEAWSHSRAGEVASHLVLPRHGEPDQPELWFCNTYGAVLQITAGADRKRSKSVVAWNAAGERSALSIALRRRELGSAPDVFVACDFARPYAFAATPTELALTPPNPGERELTLELNGNSLRVLARSPGGEKARAPTVLLTDGLGRLFLADMASAEVLTL